VKRCSEAFATLLRFWGFSGNGEMGHLKNDDFRRKETITDGWNPLNRGIGFFSWSGLF